MKPARTAFKILLVFIAAFVVYDFFYGGRRGGCVLDFDRRISIGTITYGLFTETIPQTGTIAPDSSGSSQKVLVEIDEVYLKRIFVGLKATATIIDRDHRLLITEVDTVVRHGRFSTWLKFEGDSVPPLRPNASLRLRIALSEPSMQTLLPVGGFYKDTGGLWVFVMRDSLHAERREITLGRKCPDYFEVLDGLNPGEKVITSSYDGFHDRQVLGALEMAVLWRVWE
jgi:hypothetical protein